MQTGGRGTAGKGRWVGIQVAVWACVYKPMRSLGLNIWTGYNEG